MSTTETPRPSVMIVDDNVDDLQLLAAMLRDSGFDIRLARDSAQALRSATKYPPDLIVLDIMMPMMNGLDACRILKSREDLVMVPVIFITASPDKKDKMKAFALGGVDYITKPFDLDEVLKKIEWHVQNGKRMRGLEQELHQLEQKSHGNSTGGHDLPQSTVHITERERDCLMWLARGLRNDVIAFRLGIKVPTVEMHISNARKKLGAATREQALVIAIQLGLVKP